MSDDSSVLGLNGNIIFQGLNKQDFLKMYFLQLIVCLYKEVIIIRHCLLRLEVLVRFVGSLKKTLKGDWFEQIIQNIKIKSLYCIFLVCSGEYYLRRAGKIF